MAAAAVLVVALVWWDREPRDAAKVVDRACTDAQQLHSARLLSEAALAFARIDDVDHDRRCKQSHPTAAEDRQSAAEAAERAYAYVRAADLKHVPTKADSRVRALRRARTALVDRLRLDPFDEAARSDLRHVLAQRDPPRSRTEANATCALADRVRAARLLNEAEMLYAQALRSGRNTSCLGSGLAAIRLSAAKAGRALIEARTYEATGKTEDARESYLAALEEDPSIVTARVALAGLPAGDPRRATYPGRLDVAIGNATDWLGTAVDWLAKHAGGLVLAILVLGLGVLLIMALMLWFTRARWVRRAFDWVPLLHRYTRTRTRVANFTPEDKGWSCGSVFAFYLPAPPIAGPPVGGGAVAPSKISIDVFEAAVAPADTATDAAGVLQAVPHAALLAAAATWFRENAPRREVRLFGQLLFAGSNRFGLRVLVVARNGRTLASEAFWAAELPGPAFESTEEDAARHALSIVGATWAHQKANA